MKIYIAGDYVRKEELREYRDVIETTGCTVTSRWINREDVVDGAGIGGVPIDDYNRALYGIAALTDHYDIRESDMLVLFTTGEKSRGGRHTEFGIALGLGKRVSVVGPVENVFQCQPNVECFSDFRSFVVNLTDHVV